MNPLQEYPAIRQWCYRIMWINLLTLGATQAGYAVAEQASPGWLKVALGVLAYVSVATNYTADRNVTPTTPAGNAPAPRVIPGTILPDVNLTRKDTP